MKIGKGVWITGAVLAATGIMMGGRTQAVKAKEKPTAIVVKKNTKATVYVEEKYKIQCKIKKLKKQKITWKAENKKIVSISKKKVVSVKKKGKTKVYAYIKGKKTKTYFVLKAKEPVEMKKMSIECKDTLSVGESLQVGYTTEPVDVTRMNLKFSVADKRIASITKKGRITAKKEGTTVIILRDLESQKKVTKKITVEEVPVTSVVMNQANAKTVEYGEKVKLQAYVTPSNATNQEVVWKSLNSTIATVDQDGVVTAIRPCENVDIVATSKDDNTKYAIWHLTITANKGFVTKQILDDLHLDRYKKLMIVSHPDDELFWGGGHLLQDDYFVVVMTNDNSSVERKKEFDATMKITGEASLVLNYPDSRINIGSLKQDVDCLTSSAAGIEKDLKLILGYKKWELVATHNPDGEYGKYNHQRVNGLVTKYYKEINKTDQGLYYFGKYYWGVNPGKQMEQSLVDQKVKIIYGYSETAHGAIEAFKAMIPYENWIAASDWPY